MNHELYMKRCFDLARKADHRIKTNPRVGAVIVHQDRIIGEGYHKVYGEAHAEVNALNSVKPSDQHLLAHSTMYVSLEPCAHYGKTPPCCLAISNAGIAKVVIGMVDPTDKVNQKGISHLRNHGVEVEVGVLEDEAQELIHPFQILQDEDRPYITLKWAQSKDAFMGQEDRQVWISGPECQIHSHKLRSEHDAILVGKQTVLTDDPKLNNRLYFGDNPSIVILDSNAEINHQKYNFIKSSVPIYIFNTQYSKQKGQVDYIKIDPRKIDNVLSHLRSIGIHRLLVEGGKEVLASFIKHELWDQAYVYNSQNNLIEGIQAPLLDGKLVSKNLVSNDMVYQIKKSTR